MYELLKTDPDTEAGNYLKFSKGTKYWPNFKAASRLLGGEAEENNKQPQSE
jgi:hypothetical protein